MRDRAGTSAIVPGGGGEGGAGAEVNLLRAVN